jgi:hypothetical protein
MFGLLSEGFKIKEFNRDEGDPDTVRPDRVKEIEKEFPFFYPPHPLHPCSFPY